MTEHGAYRHTRTVQKVSSRVTVLVTLAMAGQRPDSPRVSAESLPLAEEVDP